MLHSKEKITPRTILNKLVSEMDRPFVTVLIGPRQVGKTVLMRMVEERAPCKTVYLDMENPMDAVVLNNQIQNCTEHNGKPVLFLPHTLAHTVPQLWDRLPHRGSDEICNG